MKYLINNLKTRTYIPLFLLFFKRFQPLQCKTFIFNHLLEKFKAKTMRGYYTNYVNKKLSLNLTENELESYLEQEEKARKEIEKDIKQIDYKYLIDNGYVIKK